METAGRVKDKLAVLKRLSLGQKLSLLALVLLVLILPIGLLYTLNPKSFTRSRAQVATPPTPPTNTATPGPNAYPTVLTNSLKSGKVGKLYNAVVKAQDNDGDYMEINFSEFPAGISKGECQFSVGRNGRSSYECEIHGTPTAPGVFRLNITVTDEHIATTVKDIPLRILP
jgi:hypothetical protein